MSDLSLAGDTSTHDAASATAAAPHTRILSFAAAPPPPASHNPHAHAHLSLSRQYAASGRTGAARASAGATAAAAGPAAKRRIPALPDRVLDAPGFKDDYYLNLISWSSSNKVAIGLGELAYVWNADTGDVSSMGTEG